MSDNGAPCISVGSGDIEGCGVGSGGGNSGVAEFLELREGALFRFRGDALFDGDPSFCCRMLCSVSNDSGGRMLSSADAFLILPDVRGVDIPEFVVFLLDCVCLRGLRCGAGVKSSSLSSDIFSVFCTSSSSSEDSTSTFRRAATRLDGLVGDAVDILAN